MFLKRVAVMLLPIAFGGCMKSPTSSPTVSLAVQNGSSNMPLIEWAIENSTDQTIWIPMTWDWRDHAEPKPLPIPFVVPPADIMLVYGTVEYDVQRGYWGGMETAHAFVKLAPGAVLSGKLCVVTALREAGDGGDIGNPLRHNHSGLGKSYQIDLIQSVQLAVEYFVDDPAASWYDAPAEYIAPPDRYSLAYGLILGRSTRNVERRAYARIVLSERNGEVSIKLDDPIVLYLDPPRYIRNEDVEKGDHSGE